MWEPPIQQGKIKCTKRGTLYTAGNFKLYMSKCYHNNCCANGHNEKYSLCIYIWQNNNAWSSATYKHTHILTHKLRHPVHCYQLLAYSLSPSHTNLIMSSFAPICNYLQTLIYRTACIIRSYIWIDLASLIPKKSKQCEVFFQSVSWCCSSHDRNARHHDPKTYLQHSSARCWIWCHCIRQ